MPSQADRVLDNVLLSLERSRLGPSDTLVVGLSGGIDSQTLTHALVTLRDLGQGPSLRAIHVNHRLRPESDQDAYECQRAAERMGVPFQAVSVDVDQWGRARGTEAAARQARYAALASTALHAGTSWIALGHTLDDQVETILLRLARGASLDGLAGMREVSYRAIPLDSSGEETASMHVLRPLLDRRRTDVEAYADAHGLTAVEDVSNADPRYRRNAIRHQLLPVLEQIVPTAARSIARTSTFLAADADFLASLASIVFAEACSPIGPCIQIRRDAIRTVAVPVQRRVIVMSVRSLADQFDLSSERVEALRAATLTGAVSSVIEVGGGIAALVDYEHLVVGPAGTIKPVLRERSGLPLLGTGEVRQIETSQLIELGNHWNLDIQLTGMAGGWEVRTRRAGDRLARDDTQMTTLQDWYVNAKVPAYVRDHVPLLIHRGVVRWVVGFSTPEFEDVDSSLVARLVKMTRGERENGEHVAGHPST